MWGVLAVGIFGNDVNAEFAGYLGSGSGSHPFRSGEQFAVQLVGLLAILAWTVANGLIIFYGMQFTMGIRVAPVSEDSGLDKSLHGGDAYDMLPRRLEEGSSIEPAKKDEPVDITIN
jgi:Amt family ammonium transporter